MVELPEGNDIFPGLCVPSCIAWVDVCYCCFFKAVNRQQRITMFWLHEADIVVKREREKSHAIGYPVISTKRDWLTRPDSITSCYLCSWSSLHLAVLWEIFDCGKFEEMFFVYCANCCIHFNFLCFYIFILTVGSKEIKESWKHFTIKFWNY